MATTERSIEVIVQIVANEAGEAALNRYVGLDEAAGREMAITPGLTRAEVELALIRACILTGRHDASSLDGWADLERDDLEIRIDGIQDLW